MKKILCILAFLFTMPAFALNTRPCWIGTKDFGTVMPNVSQSYTMTLACASASRWSFSTGGSGFRMTGTTCKTDGTRSPMGCTVTIELKSPLGGHFGAALVALNVNTAGQANLVGKVYGPDYVFRNNMPLVSRNGIYTPTVTAVHGPNQYTIPVTNPGTEPLAISSVYATFASPAYGGVLVASNDCGDNIAPGGSCNVVVDLDLTAFDPPESDPELEFIYFDIRVGLTGNTGTNDVSSFLAYTPRV
jgi:hypothetical protein